MHFKIAIVSVLSEEGADGFTFGLPGGFEEFDPALGGEGGVVEDALFFVAGEAYDGGEGEKRFLGGAGGLDEVLGLLIEGIFGEANGFVAVVTEGGFDGVGLLLLK